MGVTPPALTNFAASDISARSTCAGGAMAMLCGGIDSDHIRLIGRRRSDEEIHRYLFVQAQPALAGVAAIVLHGGDYRLISPPGSAGTGGQPFPASPLTLWAEEVPLQYKSKCGGTCKGASKRNSIVRVPPLCQLPIIYIYYLYIVTYPWSSRKLELQL